MFKLIPVEVKFFDLFEESSINTLKAARLLQRMLEDYTNLPEKIKDIKSVEHEGDRITHYTIEKLNTTFITPFDREDIHALASALDDVLDLIDAAAHRMLHYKIDNPTKEMQELVLVLIKAIEEITKALKGFRNMKNQRAIINSCIEINSLENEGDSISRAAIGKLFDEEKDAIKLIKWKEIYEVIEDAIDRCEDVANIIEGVTLKNI
jgi:predicted phosphate transport protein (TIGR00153 family)